MALSPYSPNEQMLGRSKVKTVFKSAIKDEKSLLQVVNLEVAGMYKKVKVAGLLTMIKSGTVIDASIVNALSQVKAPSDRLGILLARAVKERVLTTDEVIKLLDPEKKFTDTKQLQAGAVGIQRREMNKYWDKEQKRFKDDVASAIRFSIKQGYTPEQAAKLLVERVGVSTSRAQLIAEDQLLTAAARADNLRQKQLGIKMYTWMTVGDNRVRLSHQERDGHDYFWSAKGEKPGDAIRCRCRAIPIV